jgi:ABC-type amino acid transport system permease subunit
VRQLLNWLGPRSSSAVAGGRHGRLHPLGHLPQPAAGRALDGGLLSLIAFIGGGVVGLALLVARLAPSARAQRGVAGYVQLFQGTPLLMQLFLAYFGLALLG